jgi:hypothetical protein
MTFKVTQLAAAASLVGTEVLPLSQLSTTVTITATTISAQASDNSFNDSGAGFLAAGFEEDDTVFVSGFTGNTANNIFSATITVLTAGKMTIGGTDGDVIVDDAAGESVTITKWVSRRVAKSTLVPVGTKTLFTWRPAMVGEPPATNFATLDTRNNHALADFDDTTDESYYLFGRIPLGKDLSSGIKMSLLCQATSDTNSAHKFKFGVSYERLTAGGHDIDSDSFGTEVTGFTTISGTSGGQSLLEITNGASEIDGLQAGDFFRARITAKPSDTTNHDITGDIELSGASIDQVA